MTDLDAAIDGMRWAKVNTRKTAHLWLGAETACGLPWGDVVHTLSVWPIALDNARCRTCSAYAQGWVDRHEFGPRPLMGEPDPMAPVRYLAGAS